MKSAQAFSLTVMRFVYYCVCAKTATTVIMYISWLQLGLSILAAGEVGLYMLFQKLMLFALMGIRRNESDFLRLIWLQVVKRLELSAVKVFKKTLATPLP